jgi:hypothetical protein
VYGKDLARLVRPQPKHHRLDILTEPAPPSHDQVEAPGYLREPSPAALVAACNRAVDDALGPAIGGWLRTGVVCRGAVATGSYRSNASRVAWLRERLPEGVRLSKIPEAGGEAELVTDLQLGPSDRSAEMMGTRAEIRALLTAIAEAAGARLRVEEKPVLPGQQPEQPPWREVAFTMEGTAAALAGRLDAVPALSLRGVDRAAQTVKFEGVVYVTGD